MTKTRKKATRPRRRKRTKQRSRVIRFCFRFHLEQPPPFVTTARPEHLQGAKVQKGKDKYPNLDIRQLDPYTYVIDSKKISFVESEHGAIVPERVSFGGNPAWLGPFTQLMDMTDEGATKFLGKFSLWEELLISARSAEDYKKEGIWTAPLRAMVLRLQWDDSLSKFVVHRNKFEFS
jgi:hypothetical protein